MDEWKKKLDLLGIDTRVSLATWSLPAEFAE
jgi:hypothetical protein